MADAVRMIKTNSSAWVNQTRGLPTAFHWQAGYGIFSISQAVVDATREYIRTQKERLWPIGVARLSAALV